MDNFIFSQNPADLPASWDDVFCNQPLMNRVFLTHLHRTNPLIQRYFWEDPDSADKLCGAICEALIPFRIGRFAFYSKGVFCSIPMPLGFEPGFAPIEKLKDVVGIMGRQKKGFQMIMGLGGEMPELKGWSWKRHYIAVNIRTNFKNFEEYLDNFRHVYRRPLKQSISKWERVNITLSQGDAFGRKDYDLYLAVLKKQGQTYSALPMDFFKCIPIEHYFIKAYHGEALLGWIVVIPYGKKLYPLFVGIDYKYNKRYDTYFNILTEAVKYAIKNRIDEVKMGQTAELAKIRLGGIPQEVHFLVRHTNPIMNLIIGRTDIFNYRKRYKPFRVFKTFGNN